MIDPVVFVVGMASWGVGIAGIRRQEKGGVTEPTVTPVIEPRRIPNLAPNGFSPIRDYESVVQGVKPAEKPDPRLQQWAYAVAYNNAPMKQTKWAGKGRPFSKPEYKRWIACLLEKKIVAVVNPKNVSSGYKPNGAQGWQTIKSIADGRTKIPLPTADLTETDIQFLRARMRAASSVGEGMD